MSMAVGRLVNYTRGKTERSANMVTTRNVELVVVAVER